MHAPQRPWKAREDCTLTCPKILQVFIPLQKQLRAEERAEAEQNRSECTSLKFPTIRKLPYPEQRTHHPYSVSYAMCYCAQTESCFLGPQRFGNAMWRRHDSCHVSLAHVMLPKITWVSFKSSALRVNNCCRIESGFYPEPPH